MPSKIHKQETNGAMCFVRAGTHPLARLKEIDRERAGARFAMRMFVMLSTALSLLAFYGAAGISLQDITSGAAFTQSSTFVVLAIITLAVLLLGWVADNKLAQLARDYGRAAAGDEMSAWFLAVTLGSCALIVGVNALGTTVGAASLLGSDIIEETQRLEVDGVAREAQAKRVADGVEAELKMLADDKTRLEAAFAAEMATGYGSRAKALEGQIREIRERERELLAERQEAQAALDELSVEQATLNSNLGGQGALLRWMNNPAAVPYVQGGLIALLLDLVGTVLAFTGIVRFYAKERLLIPLIGEEQFRQIREEEADRSGGIRLFLSRFLDRAQARSRDGNPF